MGVDTEINAKPAQAEAGVGAGAELGNKIQSKKGVVISVTLGRRLLGTFLTIFFPTILLNLIGYSTNYFKEFFFEVSDISQNIIVQHRDWTHVYSMILGSDHCKPHINVGANNDVYQREQQPAQHFLYQDDGHLAYL